MGTPHEYADVIKAWADGAEIEWKNGNKWEPIEKPNWIDQYVYRVKPHKWQSVMDAAEWGKPVEYRHLSAAGSLDADWLPAHTPLDRMDLDYPDIEWRVKPESLKYRVAVMRNYESYLLLITTDKDADDTAKCAQFVCWANDWQEAEVEA